LRKLTAIILALCMILSFNASMAFAATAPASANAAASTGYTDLPSTHWAYKVVNTLSDRGVLGGYDDGSFRPDSLVTRAEFSKMIAIFMKLNLTTTTVSSFSDVSSNHWALKYIEADKSSELISGYPDGTYKPDNSIKRSEVSRIIVAANDKLNAKSTSSKSTASTKYVPFSDIKGNWAESDIIRLREVGVADAYPDGLFRPERLCTRAEAAKLLYLLLQNVLGEKVTPPETTTTVSLGSGGGGRSKPDPEPTQEPCPPCPEIPNDENIIKTWKIGARGTVNSDGYPDTDWVEGENYFSGRVGINVPAGAVDETVTIAIAFDTDYTNPNMSSVVSGILGNTYVTQRGAFTIYKDKCYNLKFPMTVTIPFVQMPNDPDMPSVFYQGNGGKYISAGVKDLNHPFYTQSENIMPSMGTVSFSTVHGGKFVAAEIDGLYDQIFGESETELENYSTGFEMSSEGGDSFDVANDGDYRYPGGDSIGMVNYANWHFSLNSDPTRPNLYSAYAGGPDNPIERELIYRSFLASSNAWNNGFMSDAHGEYNLTDEQTMYQLVQTMLVTDMPQTLVQGDQIEAAAINSSISTSAPKALLITGFDYYGREGIEFYSYDPSYPVDEQIIQYSLGDTSFPWGQYKFFFEGISSSVEPSQYETLYYGAENEWPTNPVSDFSKIELSDPSSNYVEVTSSDGYAMIDLQGKVTGGINKAEYIVINVDGGDDNNGTAIELSGPNDNEFSTGVKLDGFGEHKIMLYSACLKGATITRCAKPYSAFKVITVNIVPSQEYLTSR
jgi:hypothetical protein